MENNQNDGSNSLLYSILLSMESAEDYELTLEDLRYLLNPAVNDCKVKLYQLVVILLSEGKSYDEIIKYIDKIDIDEYKRLTEEEQFYIQKTFRKDFRLREKKLTLEKNEGVIKYE